MNEKLVAEALGLDHKAVRTIRSQANDLTNDPIARDFYRSKMSFRSKGGRARHINAIAAATAPRNKTASVDQSIHRLRRLRRFTDLRNLRNLWIMTSFPEWLVPMAATLTQERFTGPEWIFERKFDGIRLLAYKKGDDVQLFSRNHLPQNIPAVQQAIKRLPHHELILDGEITWRGGNVAYHVFDIMWLDGRNVTTLPLEERRNCWRQLPLQDPLRRVELRRRCHRRGSARKEKVGKASSRSDVDRSTSTAARRVG